MSAEIEHKAPRQSGGFNVGVAVAVFFCWIVLYFLSPGPVVWMVNQGWIPPQYLGPLEVFYLPLSWLIENNPWIEKIYQQYFSFLGVM